MSLIAGIDLSSHAIDCVLIDENDAHVIAWHRWPLVAVGDAFDRSRWVRDSMPSRGWWIDKGVIAVGIENPAGRLRAVRAITRVQGGVLATIPTTILVHPLEPSEWRKAIGLAGNATKDEVFEWACGMSPMPSQDAADAFCIGLATRLLVETKAAA